MIVTSWNIDFPPYSIVLSLRLRGLYSLEVKAIVKVPGTNSKSSETPHCLHFGEPAAPLPRQARSFWGVLRVLKPRLAFN